jgi:hypothetical protein
LTSSSTAVNSEYHLNPQSSTEGFKSNSIIQNQDKIITRLNQLEGIGKTLNSLEQEILEEHTPELRDKIETCLNFLSPNNISLLAEKIGELSLENFKDSMSDFSLDDEQKQKFYLDLQQYIRLVRDSIITQKNSNLHLPRFKQSLSYPDIYLDCLKRMKQELPEYINIQAKEEIKSRIDYLIKRISKREV